jgi:hypothetical protein
MQIVASTKMQLDEFTVKFEKDFSLVSFLSTSTTTRGAWYLENSASHHMIEAWDIFSIRKERELYVHVELGDDAKWQCFMETCTIDLAKAYTNKDYQEKEERYNMKNENQCIL